MWFKTPLNSVEECVTALSQLEHGEMYAASKVRRGEERRARVNARSEATKRCEYSGDSASLVANNFLTT